eukprot:2088545-Pyramimonas_sp.AAC.1
MTSTSLPMSKRIVSAPPTTVPLFCSLPEPLHGVPRMLGAGCKLPTLASRNARRPAWAQGWADIALAIPSQLPPGGPLRPTVQP